jgi:hypothetical protein
LSMAGVVALTLSTEIIVAYIELPQVLLDIAGWQWP